MTNFWKKKNGEGLEISLALGQGDEKKSKLLLCEAPNCGIYTIIHIRMSSVSQFEAGGNVQYRF